jgi:predicted O-methyltransferase YrrM
MIIMIDSLRYFPTLFRVKAFGSSNVNEIVDFSFNNVLIRPKQIKEEMISFLKLINTYNLKRFLEIGTSNGGTLFAVSRVIDDNATIVSIDLSYDKLWGIFNIKLYNYLGKKEQKLHFFELDSHNLNTLSKIKSIFNNEDIDLLFIDGDHSYDGVKMDFEMYSPLVKKGGIIAVHDIAIHSQESSCEVKRFWDEIKEKYNYIEYINNPKQGCCGIGVLKL